MEIPANSSSPIGQFFLSEFQQVSKNLRGLREARRANPLLIEDWFEDMLHHFAAEVGQNTQRISLLLQHRDYNLPTLAYVVRNLLELNVWIDYCCKSKSNARRFYEDRWKDGEGLHKAFKKLIDAIPTAPNRAEIEAALTSFKKTLLQTAATAGLQSLDEDYKKVVQAADDLGSKEVFVAFNTLLSKFAHPTAMTVFTSLEGETFDRLFDRFFFIGVGLAATGWRTINAYIKDLGAIA
jgi:hypothetical protein